MKLRFRVLGSGSSGNATLVEGGGTRLLIDAGLGPRVLAQRLKEAGVEPDCLDAVLLSHEHGDHARGAARFSGKWGVPLAGSRGTYAAAGLGAEQIAGYAVLVPGTPYQVGALRVQSVAVPHDAAEPLAFVVSLNGTALGHVTDVGHVDATLADAFLACDTVLIESNYDPGLLRDGPYPWALKERIYGPHGHLSNSDVARYLTRGLGSICRTVVLAHLSRKNNHPELCRMAAEQALDRAGRGEVRVELSTPEGLGWLPVAAPEEPLDPGRAQLELW